MPVYPLTETVVLLPVQSEEEAAVAVPPTEVGDTVIAPETALVTDGVQVPLTIQ